jgi:glycosyltransferase involved in cell wall biosynthesis
MTFLAWFIFSFALLRLAIALVNLSTVKKMNKPGNDKHTLVSVLIPARNEETGLPILLDSLICQSHKHLEIIVYDDESTDGTQSVLREYVKQDSRIRYIEGSPLPEGWIGKNYACDQLAKAAEGDYLLFLDADVETGPELIAQAIAYMEAKKVTLFSLFPVQKMHSFGEWMVVPLMNWILLTLLPLTLIRHTRRSSLSAANGQFMMFQAAVYKKNLFHNKLKNERVEDIRIMRLMKSMEYRVDTLPGNDQIHCRMYNGFREAVYGFSKNVTAYFGGSYLITCMFVLLTALGWLPVLLAGPFGLFPAYLMIVILTRLVVSLISRQSPIKNILLIPLQELSLVMIVVQAVINKLKSNYVWKGRHIG